MPDKTCFVVMGFGEKTDFQTQRTLDLDKTYRGIIRPAVEACGLRCVRADDIIHAGFIDKPMYEHLLDADLVIADLSTANPNAIYELGVRHALRPNTTIVMAEDQFRFPFDLNHVVIRTYRHMGGGIDFEEVERIKASLEEAIQRLVHRDSQTDSPVYEFLNIEPPRRIEGTRGDKTDADEPAVEPDQQLFSTLLKNAQEAREKKDFPLARSLFESLHKLRPADAYIVQQLALATYKSPSASDDEANGALQDARKILGEKLEPDKTNDPETLGLWGAIHKRFWELGGDRADLDTAVWAYERGFFLKRDYYNGINYAFVLNVRAQKQTEDDEKTTDRVLARRVRTEVLRLADEAQTNLPRDANDEPADPVEAYWVAATRLEALKGLGEEEQLAEELQKLLANAPETWMADSTREQLERLGELL